jgi:hypothetical protein
MTENLKSLKGGLIQRWKDAFDEIGLINDYEKKVVSVKYASTFRYDLRDYSSGKIKAGGKMTSERPEAESNFHEYGFDKDGFPAINKFRHNWNKVDWAGYFKKERDLIEYIEFCLNTNIPSCVQRVVLKNGRKVTFQSLSINGRGSGTYNALSREYLIEKIINDNFSLMYSIEEYFFDNNSISKANGLAYGPGVEEYEYEDIYRYHENGKLKMIKTYFADGQSRVRYYKSLDKLSLTQRMNNLSQKIAEAIINYLRGVKIDSPLFYLELSYRAVENYWPSLVLFTELDKEKSLKEGRSPLLPDWLARGYIYIPQTEIEEDLQEFFQIMEETENWMSGTKMLRSAAKILTTSKLNGVIATSDDFVAYSIDGSLEANELPKILLESGADKSQIKRWKKAGWL